MKLVEFKGDIVLIQLQIYIYSFSLGKKAIITINATVDNALQVKFYYSALKIPLHAPKINVQ